MVRKTNRYMLTNSLVTKLAYDHDNGQSREIKPSSTFWTRQDGQMCIQSFRPSGDVRFEPHTYAEYTIAICLEGEIEKSQMGQTQVIGRGESIIGNYGVEHTSGYWSHNGKRCEAVVLSVDRHVLESLTKEFNLPSADGATGPAFMGKVGNAALHDCARGIAGELRAGLPGHKIVVESMATRLLVEAMRAWPRANIEKIPTDLSPRLPRRDFVRAYEFMRWCRKDSFRLQHLCQFLGSSEERFNRLFLASTRHTPANFYNRMLLERARDLLRDPGLSVKEIGYQLGFKTSSHFIAAFRREFAATPQVYRQGVSAKNVLLQLG
jgi:AraC-like DNA-binding protein